MKRPAFQFYPADWQKDLALHTCSFAARGLWMEMLCVMHEATPYGYLSLAGAPLDDEGAAIATGGDLKVYRKLLAELEAKGVFSRMPDGTIYSRRMIKDEHLRNVRAEAGSKGGNPRLVNLPAGSMVGTKVKQTPVDNSDLLNQARKQNENLVNQVSKQSPTPSSSSSSSSKNLGGGLPTVPSSDPPNGHSPPTPRADFKSLLRVKTTGEPPMQRSREEQLKYVAEQLAAQRGERG